MKTALVIGATGLTGSNLVSLLLDDNRFSKIKIFSRKSLNNQNQKIEEYIIDFNNIKKVKNLFSGDVLFSALGTTLHKAGSKEAQYNIDYTSQYNIAKLSVDNGVETYILVSAANSSPDSKIFYSKMKGELERDIKTLAFKKIRIMRPGLIEGIREKSIMKENIAIAFARIITKIPGFKKYKPISAKRLAQAMINSAFDDEIRIKEYSWENLYETGNPIYK